MICPHGTSLRFLARQKDARGSEDSSYLKMHFVHSGALRNVFPVQSCSTSSEIQDEKERDISWSWSPTKCREERYLWSIEYKKSIREAKHMEEQNLNQDEMEFTEAESNMNDLVSALLPMRIRLFMRTGCFRTVITAATYYNVESM